MAEWFNAPVLKTDVGESLPRVRIPASPPDTLVSLYRLIFTAISRVIPAGYDLAYTSETNLSLSLDRITLPSLSCLHEGVNFALISLFWVGLQGNAGELVSFERFSAEKSYSLQGISSVFPKEVNRELDSINRESFGMIRETIYLNRETGI